MAGGMGAWMCGGADAWIREQVSAGGVQSYGPLPEFLKSFHIQYFTDSGGQRWREGGGE